MYLNLNLSKRGLQEILFHESERGPQGKQFRKYYIILYILILGTLGPWAVAPPPLKPGYVYKYSFSSSFNSAMRQSQLQHMVTH